MKYSNTQKYEIITHGTLIRIIEGDNPFDFTKKSNFVTDIIKMSSKHKK